MNIQIRTATIEDRDRIAEHNILMARETEDRELDRSIISKGVEAVLKDENKGFYLVIESDEGVVGNLMITYEWSDWRNGMIWWIQSVYIRPEARGQGLFSKLYHHVLEQARAAGSPEVRLYVDKSNQNAQKVYQKLGMTVSHYDMYEVGT